MPNGPGFLGEKKKLWVVSLMPSWERFCGWRGEFSGGFGDRAQGKILTCLKRQTDRSACVRSERFTDTVAVYIDLRRFGRANGRNHRQNSRCENGDSKRDLRPLHIVYFIFSVVPDNDDGSNQVAALALSVSPF